MIVCLLQIFVASEETKFGMEEDEVIQLLTDGNWRQCRNLRICGIMAMASLTENESQIHREFQRTENLFKKIKSEYFADSNDFKHLSIGMSSDYEIALQHGSTMVRIGSKVFETN